jgi:uncharacterized protein HemY
LEKEKGSNDGDVGCTLEKLGQVYTEQRRFKEAHETLQRALRICEVSFGADNSMTANVLYDIGCLYLRERVTEDALPSAEQYLKRALMSKVHAFGDWHPGKRERRARKVSELVSVMLELRCCSIAD